VYYAREALEELEKLLIKLFTDFELRRWVRFRLQSDVNEWLPAPGSPLAFVAHELVMLLVRRGLADDFFFDDLVDSFENRSCEIEAVRCLFKVSVAKLALDEGLPVASRNGRDDAVECLEQERHVHGQSDELRLKVGRAVRLNETVWINHTRLRFVLVFGLIAVFAFSVQGSDTAGHEESYRRSSYQGAIYDAESRNPIEGAIVYLMGTDCSTVTDRSGYFAFLACADSGLLVTPSLIVDIPGRGVACSDIPVEFSGHRYSIYLSDQCFVTVH